MVSGGQFEDGDDDGVEALKEDLYGLGLMKK